MALSRRRRSPALVPLARLARKRDLLGRAPHTVPASGAAGRHDRPGGARRGSAAAWSLRALVRPRRGEPLLALRGRRGDPRGRGRHPAPHRRAAARGRRPRRLARADDGRAGGAGGAARRGRAARHRAPRLGCGPVTGLVAARARRTCRGLADRRPGRRPSRWPRRAATRRARSGRGHRPAATRVSTCRSSSPRSSAGPSPASHLGLPAYLGDDGLFEGRAVVRLPRRSGRRSS